MSCFPHTCSSLWLVLFCLTCFVSEVNELHIIHVLVRDRNPRLVILRFLVGVGEISHWPRSFWVVCWGCDCVHNFDMVIFRSWFIHWFYLATTHCRFFIFYCHKVFSFSLVPSVRRVSLMLPSPLPAETFAPTSHLAPFSGASYWQLQISCRRPWNPHRLETAPPFPVFLETVLVNPGHWGARVTLCSVQSLRPTKVIPLTMWTGVNLVLLSSAADWLVIITCMERWGRVNPDGPALVRLLAEHSSFDFTLLLAVLLDGPHEVVANNDAEVVVEDQQGN